MGYRCTLAFFFMIRGLISFSASCIPLLRSMLLYFWEGLAGPVRALKSLSLRFMDIWLAFFS